LNSAVDRAIKCIWERYDEPISLTDLAESAILSRFHFCRVFRSATGVTPGRFLSAVRIYQAKRMLLTTSMNITDISFAVGYNSLGSFTNHFTDSVGVSPGRFRRISQNGGFAPPDPLPDPDGLDGVIAGMINLPEDYVGARAYVGVFDTPIMQRRPAAAAVVDIESSARPAPFRLAGIPEGTWHVHAVAVADTGDPEPWTRRTLLVGGRRPVRVATGVPIRVSVSLRLRRATDLPVLLALPDLETPPDGFTPAAEAEERAAAVMDLTSPPLPSALCKSSRYAKGPLRLLPVRPA
jgi:AraC family transcriptional regulator